MSKARNKKKKKQQGLTLLETVMVAALMLVVILPLMSVYIQSVTNMYVVDKLTETQKQAHNALYFIGQDLGGAEEFLNISTTRLAVRTYRATTVGFYLASDSTLRRISSYTNTGSYTGGETKARNITDLRFTYYFDTTYTTTLTESQVRSLRFDVTVNITASTLTNPNSLDTVGFNVGSFVWCRNRTTN